MADTSSGFRTSLAERAKWRSQATAGRYVTIDSPRVVAFLEEITRLERERDQLFEKNGDQARMLAEQRRLLEDAENTVRELRCRKK